jgi:hypothetical protein
MSLPIKPQTVIMFIVVPKREIEHRRLLIQNHAGVPVIHPGVPGVFRLAGGILASLKPTTAVY